MKAVAKMKQKKGKQGADLDATQPKEKSVAHLAMMLSNSEDVDDAIRFEEAICKKIDEKSVSGIKSLFYSKDRYCNIAALRILSDSGRVGISNAYPYMDQLFELDDLILKRMCIRLIEQHNYYQSTANNRMAQFSDFPDEPIKRSVRVWLLWRTPEELREFLASYQSLSKDIRHLIDLIGLVKSEEISRDEFFERLSAVDIIAFEEFTELAKRRFSRARVIFYGDK